MLRLWTLYVWFPITTHPSPLQWTTFLWISSLKVRKHPIGQTFRVHKCHVTIEGNLHLFLIVYTLSSPRVCEIRGCTAFCTHFIERSKDFPRGSSFLWPLVSTQDLFYSLLRNPLRTDSPISLFCVISLYKYSVRILKQINLYQFLFVGIFIPLFNSFLFILCSCSIVDLLNQFLLYDQFHCVVLVKHKLVSFDYCGISRLFIHLCCQYKNCM